VVISVGPAVVHDLDDRGDTLFVDLGPFSRAYGAHRQDHGQAVDGVLRITSEAEEGDPAGGRLVAEQEVLVNRTSSQERDTIRVYVLPGDRNAPDAGAGGS
jgi:hypothetical protein